MSIKIRNLDEKEFKTISSLEERIKFVLRYAILAPSTHNTQPWKVEVSQDSCKIFVDPKLKLAEADPHDRCAYISIGAFIENLIISSKYFGIFESTEYKLTDNLVAIVKFHEPTDPTLSYEYLLKAIPKRVNARGIFKDEPLPEDLLVYIKRITDEYSFETVHTNLVIDKKKIHEIGELTAQGLQHAHKNKSFREEMSGWMLNSWTLKKEGMPGYSLRMPLILSFILPTLVRFVDMGKFLGKLNLKSIKSAPAICILSTDNAKPEEWLKVGRIFERINLEGVSRGFYSSVFVASIEYNLIDKINLNFKGEPQFLFAMGKPEFISKATPRHEVKSKLY